MTLEQIQSLTDDELRVRVAELAGAKWQEVPPRDGYSYRPKRLLSFHTWDFDSPRCAPLPFPNQQGDAYSGPNYPADLNACRGFERDLAGFNPQTAKSQYGDYISALQTITGWWRTPCAPARARCEAFLAVMGKDTP